MPLISEYANAAGSWPRFSPPADIAAYHNPVRCSAVPVFCHRIALRLLGAPRLGLRVEFQLLV